MRSINLDGFLKLLGPELLSDWTTGTKKTKKTKKKQFQSVPIRSSCFALRLRNVTSNYDLVYVPVGNKRSTNLGLAFVPCSHARGNGGRPCL